MTPPMTPREKVVFKQPCKHCQRMTTVDLNALASGSGDHAELDVVAWRVKHPRHDAHRLCFVPAATDEAEPLVTAASAEALLAENAALRTRENELIAGHAVAVAALERKLAEAVGLLRRIGFTPEGEDGLSLNEVVSAARTFLSEEAERG